MSNVESMKKSESLKPKPRHCPRARSFRHLGFGLLSSFGLRHSSTKHLHETGECVPVDGRMKHAVGFFWAIEILLGVLFFSGCQTVPQGIQQAKIDLAQRIAAEPPGDYFIGRRYFKPDFKFWGYVRSPGQPWSTAQLVMLNEKQKLAPDRERVDIGSDNNHEYKLYGYFSGDKVYEPASNTIYPEFVLKGYEVISTNPPPIFSSPLSGRSQAEESRYQIEKPQL